MAFIGPFTVSFELPPVVVGSSSFGKLLDLSFEASCIITSGALCDPVAWDLSSLFEGIPEELEFLLILGLFIPF